MAGGTKQVIEAAEAFCHLCVISLSQSDTRVDSWLSMKDRPIGGADAIKTQIHLFPEQKDERHNTLFSPAPSQQTNMEG